MKNTNAAELTRIYQVHKRGNEKRGEWERWVFKKSCSGLQAEVGGFSIILFLIPFQKTFFFLYQILLNPTVQLATDILQDCTN